MIPLSRYNNYEEFLSLPNSVQSYVAATNNIEITVWPEFIDSRTTIIGSLFVWAYHVRIDNKSNDTVKLVSRYWRIIDEKGGVQEVDGEGVIGEQPIIKPNDTYQYSSGVHLRHASGIMSGKYKMQMIDHDRFLEVRIPTFSLDVPGIASILN